MGFIEEMAKAKAYDNMQSRQMVDTMNAARTALQEQKDKEFNMNKVFQKLVGQGLAGSVGTTPEAPTQRNAAIPVVPEQGLASTLTR